MDIKYKFTLTPTPAPDNFFVKSLFGAAIVLVLLKILLIRNSSRLKIDAVQQRGVILETQILQGLVLMSSVTFTIASAR